ncbi:potassium channel family protein [Haloarcula litorea]|uniref:potassium channel family protein n=1 Tax=Haloarcula litorea TaxID=3032579 RepID=UPI0023E8B3C2|nr:TrkA family potassium uptake protein [Halomicroarcula sp. GDY20]
MTGKLDIVIAGGGRVGFQTARLLEERGHDVTVVEQDSDRCAVLADAYVATVIEGDATNPGILEQAGVETADTVAGLSGEAGLNLAVCLAARELAPDVRTVARVDTAERAAYDRFVDAVVFPELAGARVAANEVLGSDVQSLADTTGRLDIMHLRVAEGAPAAGKSLAAVRLPKGAVVVSDESGDRVAGPETVLTAGERYVVAVEPGVADEVMNLFRG